MTRNEMVATLKDAFIILNRASRIEYIGGDFWAIDDEHREHPLVPRLRMASMESVVTEAPKEPVAEKHDDLVDRLREERRANENMRTFLVELEDICRGKGMPDAVVGRNVLQWIRDNTK